MIRRSVPDCSAARLQRGVTAAVGVLVAATVLSACGSTAHPGTAAVVGSHRITTSAVQAQVAAFRDAVAEQRKGPAQPEPAGLTRDTVRNLVISDLVEKAMHDHGLVVTDSEVAQARASDARQLGGETGLRQALLQEKGVVPADIDDFYRRLLGMSKLAGISGQDPNTEQGTAALRKTLADSARNLKVEINPRYGTWDPQKITFGDGAEAWLHKQSTPAA